MKRHILAAVAAASIAAVSAIALARPSAPEFKAVGTPEQLRNVLVDLWAADCDPCVVRGQGWSEGGFEGIFMRAGETLQKRGQRLVVDGDCMSMCTVMADRLRASGSVCLTPRAQLWVHIATNGMTDALPVYTPEFLAYLMRDVGLPPSKTNAFNSVSRAGLDRFFPSCEA